MATSLFFVFGENALEEIEIENIKIKKEVENKNTELHRTGNKRLKICLECAKEIAPKLEVTFQMLEGSLTEKGRLYNVSFMSVTSEKLLQNLNHLERHLEIKLSI